MKSWLRACCCLSLAGAACDDARLVDGFSQGVTQIRVQPEAFLGAVECAPGAEGGLQGYVVKLEVVSPSPFGDASVEGDLQWSPFVPCDRTVAFPAIGGRLYAADIRGFDRVVDEDELRTAEGRWAASCGRGSSEPSDAGAGEAYAPTRASSGDSVLLLGCTEFEPSGGAGALIVDVAGALGELQCGSAAGQVAYLTAQLGKTRVGAPCGSALIVPINDGLSRRHTLDLFGYEGAFGDAGDAGSAPPLPPPDASVIGESSDAGGDAGDAGDAGGIAQPPVAPAPADAGALDAGAGGGASGGVLRWQTRCSGRSIPGVTTRAVCEPFAAVAPQ